MVMVTLKAIAPTAQRYKAVLPFDLSRIERKAAWLLLGPK